MQVAVALEKAALSDEYFVKRKLYPNVDFYSGLIYKYASINYFVYSLIGAATHLKYLLLSSMGFPTEFFPVLFAIARMAGYLSHWRESLDDHDTKVMRPQQVIINFDDTYLPSFLFSVI